MVLESIAWSGEVLTAIIKLDGRTCSIERDAIHTLPMYNDAVEWEIEGASKPRSAQFASSLGPVALQLWSRA